MAFGGPRHISLLSPLASVPTLDHTYIEGGGIIQRRGKEFSVRPPFACRLTVSARLCEVFGPKEAEDKSFQESEIVNRRHIGQRPNRRAWRLEATVKQQQKQELILLWLKRKEGNSVCHSLILPFSSPPGGE